MNFHFFLIVAAVIGSSHSWPLDPEDMNVLTQICLGKRDRMRPDESMRPDHSGGHELLRPPKNTDIAVICGTDSISLAIQACSIVFAGYKEIILNNVSDPACRGTLDTSVSPPVVRFSFPLNFAHACGSVFRTTCAAVNVSGVVQASDPTTENAEMEYYYSCAYPLEYRIYNTQIDVSASSIALTDKNGSFVGTLRLELFSDEQYKRPLVMPQDGIELSTRIYVELTATNLMGQYNVLLDRCYASVSPLPSSSSFSYLNIPCGADDQLNTVIQNGISQIARCSFPAFDFMELQEETVSTYYLHCSTRLCEVHPCQTFMECNGWRCRRCRYDKSSHRHTITSLEIHVRR